MLSVFAGVFLLLSLMLTLGTIYYEDAWFFVKSDSFFDSSLNFNDYVDKSITLFGNYQLKQTLCRTSGDCDYDVYFSFNDSSSNSFQVYKKENKITCFDEFSKYPRRFIKLTCGVRYVDSEIQKEKYELINLEFDNLLNYTFIVREYFGTIYLELP